MGRYVTKNYGRKSGMLDATKHIDAAIPRLLTASECHRCEFARAMAPVPQVPRGRDC